VGGGDTTPGGGGGGCVKQCLFWGLVWMEKVWSRRANTIASTCHGLDGMAWG